jgi:phosphohistidine swiveling domain-containing protein
MPTIPGLPTSGQFYFEKTEVCDVAPRPSPATFRLLEELYATSGPIDRAYRSQGIAYTDTRFLRLIAGELFIDREREIQSLFPSYSYFSTNPYSPKQVRLTGLWTSFKNTGRLQNLRGDLGSLSTDCANRLRRPLESTTFDAAKQDFFQDYELIFTINLLAGQSITRLQHALPSSITIAGALSYFPLNLPSAWEAPTGLVGNTLDLTDASAFVSRIDEHTSQVIPSEIPVDLLFTAQSHLRLREYGRWLAIRHITHLRSLIPSSESRASDDPEQSRPASKDPERSEGPRASLPSIITDQKLPPAPIKSLGVSAGIATGKLVTTPEPGGILVVSTLSPAMVAHIPTLAGVIADHGSVLSHFAIVAREAGFPVVVKYPTKTLPIGQTATINGGTGKVTIHE